MPEWLTIENITAVVTAVVTLASVIAAITPSTTDNEYLQRALDLLNRLGLNVGKAQNRDDWRGPK